MSLLYKKLEDTTTSVDIKQENGSIEMTFWSDCGKHGTDEILDIHDMTPEKLLEILQEYESKQED